MAEPSRDISLVILATSNRPDIELFRQVVETYRQELVRLGRSFEIIIVDDGVGGLFQEEAQELARRHIEIRIIRFRRSFGESVALSTAVDHARGRFVLTSTWYQQVETEGIAKAIALLDEGYEYVAVRREPRKDGVLARIQSWLFNSCTRWLTKVRIHDLNCSFRAFRRNVVEELSFHGDMFRFLSILAIQKGFRVKEIPLRHEREEGPPTILNPGLYVRRFLDIIALFFLIKFTTKPLRFFGMVGAGFFLIGLTICTYMTYEKLFADQSLGDKPMLILGIFLIVLGIIVGSIGLIGEIIIYTQGKDLNDYHIAELIEGSDAREVPAATAASPSGESSPLAVSILAPGRDPDWQEYVDRHPAGTLFHGLKWRDLLQATFQHRHHYLMAERDGAVCGVLPLVEIRSIFFGRSLISVPYGVYGGVLADDEESTNALVREGRRLAQSQEVDYVELRHLERPPGLVLPGSSLYCTFIRDLPEERDDVLTMIPRKARAEVRKLKKRSDISVDTGRFDVEEFYRLFAENKRSLGSPIFPKSLFWHLDQIFGEDLDLLRVKHDGETVCSVLSFRHGDTLMAYYSGAAASARGLSASNLMYAALMEHAVDLGLKRFDFGRSRKDTGSYSFKKNQGFEPTPLHYDFILRQGEEMPAVNASNPRYDFAKKVFRKLPPVAAEKLGSFVAKRMPV